MYDRCVEFDTLMGKVLKEVNIGSDNITFITDNGEVYNMYHDQDCCESVYIESVVGDVEDLIGVPLLIAEESTSGENPEGVDVSEYQESYTWTFYKLATIKGYVDIRWYGESNGYYSESVSLYKV